MTAQNPQSSSLAMYEVLFIILLCRKWSQQGNRSKMAKQVPGKQLLVGGLSTDFKYMYARQAQSVNAVTIHTFSNLLRLIILFAISMDLGQKDMWTEKGLWTA